MSENIVEEFNKIEMDLSNDGYRTAVRNSYRNNYDNVLAPEKTRVKLNLIAYDGLFHDNDYINANYVFDNYIATQQPNEHTIDIFWRMVYENKINVIINLTNVCNYLPSTHEYNSYSKMMDVKCISENVSDDYIVRSVEVKKKVNYNIMLDGNEVNDNSNDVLIVYLCHFTKWPDHDVPDNKKYICFLNEVHRIESMIKKENNGVCKFVVHCLAGIGRTGTFILTHRLLNLKKNGATISNEVIIENVKRLRKERPGSIQNTLQFKLAYDIIMNFNL